MGKKKEEDVVATGKALELAAQWLGVDKDEVIDKQSTQQAPADLGQYTGLGFKKKGLAKSKKNMWKLDERLAGNVTQSSKKRRQEHYPRKKSAENSTQEASREPEEEMGRSAMVTERKVHVSKDDLLKRPKKKNKR